LTPDPSSYAFWPSISPFFWQELWLVVAKALTPGLHPILYHNNHAWTGDAPNVELLQGSGALATFTSGLTFLVGLAYVRRASATWRLLLFWMAFQGLNQSLTQLAIGAVLPGNDIGRTLAYLHVGAGAKWGLFAFALAGLAAAGNSLARAYPGVSVPGATVLTRAFVQEMLLILLPATVLIVPFRVPRDPIEVAFVPLFVNLVGVGWLAMGATTVRGVRSDIVGRPAVIGPALALVAILLIFQLILRPGIPF
jgi:hypothetical protein